MHNYVARRFTMIILAAAIAISANFNIVQFQLSKSIQDNIAELQNENSQLREQLITAKSTDNSSSYSAEHNNGIQQAPLSLSDANNSSLSRSITAVAVKAVATTDGFFQTVGYEGAVMDIVVEIIENGQGRILVNTEVPTGVDFQSSAKIAVKVAQDLTGVRLSSKDVIFSITAKGNAEDLQAVDGGSAGAAMTILLMSELQGKSNLNQTVLSLTEPSTLMGL